MPTKKAEPGKTIQKRTKPTKLSNSQLKHENSNQLYIIQQPKFKHTTLIRI